MKNRRRGFTLIEMMVAVALFAIVMLIAGGTLLSLVYANRKAQALQSVINNLNVSLDGMVRNIREGSDYRCYSNEAGNSDGDNDCASGTTAIYFTPFGATAGDESDDDGYALCSDQGGEWSVALSVQSGINYSLCETAASYGGVWVPITSSEVQIQGLTFYVAGTTPASKGGTEQPKVVFILTGEAGAEASTTVSTFDIQATAVQRVLNL